MNGANECLEGVLVQELDLVEEEDDPSPFLPGGLSNGLEDIGEVLDQDTGVSLARGGFDIESRGQGSVGLHSQRERPHRCCGRTGALARRALLQVSPKARWGERARAAAATVRSFSLTVQPDGSLTTGLDVEPSSGKGDTGVRVQDLPDVFEAIGEAAREKGRGVVFLFDEIQFLHKNALEALIGAVHRTVQRGLPVTCLLY